MKKTTYIMIGLLLAGMLLAGGVSLWVPLLMSERGNDVLVLEGEIPVTILLEPGQVSIIKSSCPDQVCVNTGVLTRPGQSAVCLPARVAVRITGETRSDGQSPVDGMTG